MKVAKSKALANVGEEKNIPVINATTRVVVTQEQLAKLRSENKSVAMVGFSSRHRHLAPLDDPNIEIWGLNRIHQQDWFTRWDRMFQLHPISYLEKCRGMSAGDRDHYDWLCKEHDKPIFCQEVYKEFPSAVRFPIEEMRNKYGDFYTSTLAYMMALALHEGFTHFELYGFDMEAETEYKHQRDSAEYFLGLAEGLGSSVYLPKNSSLLKGGVGMYAFETTEVGFRQLLEGRVIQLQAQMDEAGAKYNGMLGKSERLNNLVKKYPELQAEIDINDMEIGNQAGVMNVISGAQSEIRETIKMFDEHYNQVGVEAAVSEVSNE